MAKNLTVKFDQMGRHCVFDAVPLSLMQKSGFLNTFLWMTSGHMMYHSWYLVPYAAFNFKASATCYGLMNLYNLIRHYGGLFKLARIYLLQDMQNIMI